MIMHSNKRFELFSNVLFFQIRVILNSEHAFIPIIELSLSTKKCLYFWYRKYLKIMLKTEHFFVWDVYVNFEIYLHKKN